MIFWTQSCVSLNIMKTPNNSLWKILFNIRVKFCEAHVGAFLRRPTWWQCYLEVCALGRSGLQMGHPPTLSSYLHYLPLSVFILQVHLHVPFHSTHRMHSSSPALSYLGALPILVKIILAALGPHPENKMQLISWNFWKPFWLLQDYNNIICTLFVNSLKQRWERRKAKASWSNKMPPISPVCKLCWKFIELPKIFDFDPKVAPSVCIVWPDQLKL